MPDHRRRVSDYGKVAVESGRRLFLDVLSVVRVDDNFVRWRLAVGAVHPVFFFLDGFARSWHGESFFNHAAAHRGILKVFGLTFIGSEC